MPFLVRPCLGPCHSNGEIYGPNTLIMYKSFQPLISIYAGAMDMVIVLKVILNCKRKDDVDDAYASSAEEQCDKLRLSPTRSSMKRNIPPSLQWNVTVTKNIGRNVSFRLLQRDIIHTKGILLRPTSPIVDKALVQLNTRLSQEYVIIALGLLRACLQVSNSKHCCKSFC